MATTERAATRSPIILILKVSREAEIPSGQQGRHGAQTKGQHGHGSFGHIFRYGRLDKHGGGQGTRQESAGRPQGCFRNGARPLQQGRKETVSQGLEGHREIGSKRQAREITLSKTSPKKSDQGACRSGGDPRGYSIKAKPNYRQKTCDQGPQYSIGYDPSQMKGQMMKKTFVTQEEGFNLPVCVSDFFMFSE